MEMMERTHIHVQKSGLQAFIRSTPHDHKKKTKVFFR
jgi:hypothetical protein